MGNFDWDDQFWSSDSESMARMIQDRIGWIDLYNSELDFDENKKIFCHCSQAQPRISWMISFAKSFLNFPLN